MADLIFLAGQAFSISGLAYGWFIALTYCEQTIDARIRRDKPALLHHLAIA